MSRRESLIRRLGWSLGAASLWTWGLLGLRMLRDGLQPLEVWFGYSLSFFMTAVYVYLGLLISTTIKAERAELTGRPTVEATGRWSEWQSLLARIHRPVSVVGLAGLATSVVSLAGWLALRYPGPDAVPGTYASAVLALMILGVTVVSTWIARE